MNEKNGIAGTTTNGECVGTGVLTHAENNDTLPDTGPEIILLLIITFLLAGGYMYTRSIRV
ncbi:hypothetical protein LAT59_01270 [Candidatus Gracilibacteria bacterium]|nr:hypothetical protein [Candidatus Gracilibacteria bacterium]